MKNDLLMKWGTIVGYLLWGVFANALFRWIIAPLIQDLAIFGVLIVALIVVFWISSILPAIRRRWISFTLFSLILGQGLSIIALSSPLKAVALGAVMVIGLFIIAFWFGKVRFLALLAGTVGIVAASLWLPFTEWPFLTQFKVSHHGKVHIQIHDMPEAPFDVIHTKNGDEVVTVDGYKPSKALLQQLVEQATHSPSALQDVLQTAHGQYRLVVIKDANGRTVTSAPTAKDLALVNPLHLVSAFLPYEVAHWDVVNGHVSEYLTPFMQSRDAVALSLNTASYSQSIRTLTAQAVNYELKNWNGMLQQLGVHPQHSGWFIESGHLVGSYNGKSVRARVSANAVVGVGHFTSTAHQQVLLVGDNQLQIFDPATGKVVSTYKGTTKQPVPNDIVIGKLTQSGPDAIFVNASPAYVIEAQSGGSWKTMYTATSRSFRFETVMNQDGKNPEIVTNDPSKIRNSPTRYFSAYRFVPGPADHQGQLEREWRVFRTNVVNVTPAQLSRNGTEQLIVGIYGTGEYLVLQKTHLPIVVTSYIVLSILICAGWLLRLRRRKGGQS